MCFTQSLCVRPHDLMLVVCLLHKSIYMPSWRTYCECQLSSWGMHAVTAECITGFEAGLLPSDRLPLCKRLATTFKIWEKMTFQRFHDSRQGLYQLPQLMWDLCSSSHLLPSPPMSPFTHLQDPSPDIFARWSKWSLLAFLFHVPLNSDTPWADLSSSPSPQPAIPLSQCSLLYAHL